MSEPSFTLHDIAVSLENHCKNGVLKANSYGRSAIARYIQEFSNVTYQHAVAVSKKAFEVDSALVVLDKRFQELRGRWWVILLLWRPWK